MSDDANTACAELPRYRCHKEVHALKISRVELYGSRIATTGGKLHFDDGVFQPIEVDEQYMRKHNPVEGGYYVVYEGGYKSWSPGDVFEAGYTRI